MEMKHLRRTFPAVIANAKSTPKALFFFLGVCAQPKIASKRYV